jgi:hypothetical protein
MLLLILILLLLPADAAVIRLTVRMAESGSAESFLLS